MSLFAIADLHLSLGEDKPMDVFSGWNDYVQRLEENWRRLVTEDDTVVIAGDISWAMKLEETLTDFRFIDSLPGKKLLLKGNHDYWWSTKRKTDMFLQEHHLDSMQILFNNAYRVGDYAVCGTRGWFLENDTPEDVKVLNREVGRLRFSLEEAKRLKLPYFEGAAAGFPSPAADYQHESLDLNEKFVHHPEASYFVRVKGESMIGLGILDGDICLADRQEEISDGHIVVAFVNGGLTVKTLDTSTRDKGYLRLLPANPDFKPIIIDANDQFIIQGRVTSIHRDIRRH